jgi:hypothetical protein
MKIDRCLPRYKEITNKEFYLIVTAADPQHSAADETIAGLRGLFAMSARCKRKKSFMAYSLSHINK